uniref:Arylesterase n=1 Tax=Caenorhabditis japonica TaxID=281687 RepID=A0A8R1DMP1_CAEJA
MSTDSVFVHFVQRFVFWVLFAMISCFVLRVLITLDLNKRVYNHTPGPCRVLTEKYKGTAGLVFVESQKRVYITFGYGKAHNLSTKTGIAFYDTNRADAAKNPQKQYDITEMSVNWNDYDGSTFIPTGIDAYSSSNGRVLLYVLNSHPDHQCIHFFQVDQLKLNHRKAFCDSAFTSLQDITVVGPDRFFVTNLAAFGRGWPQVFEFALQTGQGAVYYYDGTKLSTAVSGVNTPTAIGYDSKKRILYVGSLIRESLYSYKVNKDMSLESLYEMMLLTSPIGMFVESKSGDVWIAAHPVLSESAYHYTYPDQKRVSSSSQVLRIRFQEDGKTWVTTEPYANDGATISASSSIVFHDDQMLIGSSFGRLLHCDLTNSHIT